RDPKVPHRHTCIAHVSSHAHSLHHTRRVCRRTDGTWRSVEHRAVSCAATPKMMPLDQARKTTAFARPHDMDQFVRIKDIDHYLVAWICRFITLHQNFPRESSRRDVRFFEMTGHCLVHAFRLDELDKAELHSVVTILLLGLLLNHDTRPGLNHGYRHY